MPRKTKRASGRAASRGRRAAVRGKHNPRSMKAAAIAGHGHSARQWGVRLGESGGLRPEMRDVTAWYRVWRSVKPATQAEYAVLLKDAQVGWDWAAGQHNKLALEWEVGRSRGMNPSAGTFTEIGYYDSEGYHLVERLARGTLDSDAWLRAQRVSRELGHPVQLIGRGAPVTVSAGGVTVGNPDNPDYAPSQYARELTDMQHAHDYGRREARTSLNRDVAGKQFEHESYRKWLHLYMDAGMRPQLEEAWRRGYEAEMRERGHNPAGGFEDAEPNEPEEGDWVTEDHTTFREHGGRGVVHVPGDRDWRAVLRLHMKRERFWPNVWFLSDHGNYHPLSLSKRNPIHVGGTSFLSTHMWMHPRMDDAAGASLSGEAIDVPSGHTVTVLRRGVGRGMKERVLVTTEWAGQRLWGWTMTDYLQDEDPYGGQENPSYPAGTIPYFVSIPQAHAEVLAEEANKLGIRARALPHGTRSQAGRSWFVVVPAEQEDEANRHSRRIEHEAYKRMREHNPAASPESHFGVAWQWGHDRAIADRDQGKPPDPWHQWEHGIDWDMRKDLYDRYGEGGYQKLRQAFAGGYVKGYGIDHGPLKRLEMERPNPAASPEQYRLAQAVLSGTARGHMPEPAAREIVERTPAGLRSEYSRYNPVHERPPLYVAQSGDAKARVTEGEFIFQGKATQGFTIRMSHGLGTEDATSRPTLREAIEYADNYVYTHGPYSSTKWRAEQAGNPDWMHHRPLTGEDPLDVAFDAGKGWGETGAAESGVANARVRRYGFLKWYNNQAPGHLYREGPPRRKLKQSQLEKAFNEGYKIGKGRFNKTYSPAARGFAASRRNPADGAAALYEEFHGVPSESETVITEEIQYHGHLGQLGELIELKVTTLSGYKVVLDFTNDSVLLCASEDGRQLYFRGGQQDLDLAAIHMNADEFIKDLMVIGDITEVSYETAKKADGLKKLTYFHPLKDKEGAVGTERVYPVLLYDTLNAALSVAGGSYATEERGLVG